jgi:PleD family two-component response regulator
MSNLALSQPSVISAPSIANHSRVPHILLVDDDPNLRMLLSYALEQEGYLVTEAVDGMTAIQTLQKHQFDLILMDAVMPRLDGISCCDKLHEIYQEDCPPILIVTALSDTESIDRAFKAGAKDFVTKPIHWPILRTRLKYLLDFFALQQEIKLSQSQIANLTAQLAEVNMNYLKSLDID